jgi:cobalt-zinc-cadmium efflux system protein
MIYFFGQALYMSLSHSINHNHDHHHSGNSHRLLIGLLLTLSFAGVEAVGGWWSGSLALLGDAGHMLSDSAALTIALVASYVMRRPPSERLSYGHGRVEVVAAIVNSMFMLLIVVGIVLEAFDRFQRPGQVHATSVMLIGAVGLAVNIVVAAVLSGDRHNLNSRAALLHVLGDLLGSIAAIVSGAIIYLWGWLPADPIVSLLICSLIIVSSVRLLKEAIHIIMEGVPRHLDLREVGEAMAGADTRILSIHDLHIWTLSSGHIALSAHVVVDHMDHWLQVLQAEQALLAERFDIRHVTLQPEIAGTEVVIPVEKLTG